MHNLSDINKATVDIPQNTECLKFFLANCIICDEQKLSYLKFSIVKYIICYEQKLFYLKFSMVKYIKCYEQKLCYLKFSMVKYIICYGYLINVGSVQEVVNRLKCLKGICAKDQFLG